MHWFSRPSLPEADPADAASEIGAGRAFLLDVRDPHEWAAGHAVGATHIPLTRLSSRIGEVPRDRAVYVICASGNRSKVATQILLRAGVDNAVNVRGGTGAWMRAGLPVTRG